MKKSGKRILSFILTAVMVFALLPVFGKPMVVKAEDTPAEHVMHAEQCSDQETDCKCHKGWKAISTWKDLKSLGEDGGSGYLVKDIEIYEPVGCPECDDTGFRGRIAVYEIMEISPEIKRMIVDNARTEDIKQQAVKDGMFTLRMAAAECVLKGITDIKSLLKVSYEG